MVPGGPAAARIHVAPLAGDRIEVHSAGSEPAAQINPVAVAAMAEEGIDITSVFIATFVDSAAGLSRWGRGRVEDVPSSVELRWRPGEH